MQMNKKRSPISKALKTTNVALNLPKALILKFCLTESAFKIIKMVRSRKPIMMQRTIAFIVFKNIVFLNAYFLPPTLLVRSGTEIMLSAIHEKGRITISPPKITIGRPKLINKSIDLQPFISKTGLKLCSSAILILDILYRNFYQLGILISKKSNYFYKNNLKSPGELRLISER